MGKASEQIGPYDHDDKPDTLYYPAWCLNTGEVFVGLGDLFDDAYEHYCTNPQGFTESQLIKCRWRGVFKIGELMDAIQSIR